MEPADETSDERVSDNVVPCCRRCNFAKGTASYEEFVAWFERAADFVVAKRQKKDE